MVVPRNVGTPPQARPAKPTRELETVTIRFAGDSGDGMQLTGTQFSNESALAGNDIATFPDFPAEIRAPAGTLAGVSGFQLNFSSRDIYTPGDNPDVLVAMNAAALRVNLGDLKPNGILLLDSEGFDEQSLKKAGYTANPIEDGSLARYQVFAVDVTKMTLRALEDLHLSNKVAIRCKNFFALGLCSWLFTRPLDPTLKYIESRFKKDPAILEANLRALRAGWNYGETAELFAVQYEVKPARIAPIAVRLKSNFSFRNAPRNE